MQGCIKLLLRADTKSQPMGYKPALSFKGYAPDNGRPSVPGQACKATAADLQIKCCQLIPSMGDKTLNSFPD